MQVCPPLDVATEAALRASIERFGVLVPVVHDQHGRILDGHHRSRLADALGVRYRVDTVRVADDAEAQAVARSLNVDRRHLSAAQRREIAAALRAEGHSLRAIAGATPRAPVPFVFPPRGSPATV
jgi:ParB family chromosome partitioning protein